VVERAALSVLRRARAGDQAGQLALGRLYLEGRGGLAADPASAFVWLERAARQGSREAVIAIGERVPAAAVPNPRSAAQLFEHAAASGCAHARKVLADWLLAGLDIGISPERALELIEAAARDGDLGAQLRLAYCLERGEGCLPDLERALHWYEQAARSGSVAAQEALADHYWRLGRRDAASWLERCARHGSDAAAGRLGVLLLRDGKPADALPLLQRGAEAGEVEAQLALARLHATRGGRSVTGVPHTYKKAAAWLDRAARQGSAEAWYELSRLYSLRSNSLRDPWTARRCLERAAELGHVEAQYRCGDAYLRHGRGPEDEVTAAGWLMRAASGGHREAARLLGQTWPTPPGPPPEVVERQEAAIRAIARVDLPLATRLELGAVLGLRLDEALLVEPRGADRGCCLVLPSRTRVRGSRRGLVLVDTADKRALLDRAKGLLVSEAPTPEDKAGEALHERKRRLTKILEKLGFEKSLFDRRSPSRSK